MSWRWVKLRGVGHDELVRKLNESMLLLTHELKTIRGRQTGVRTLTDGDATPSAQGAYVLVTANTGSTTITALDDGQPGWRVCIVFGDGNTTLQHGSNLQLIGDSDFTGAAGDVLELVTDDGTVWRENPQPHRWS